MPTRAADIVTKMRQALALSEPDLDTSIGTTVRKILDAVSEVVAEASIDTYLLDYQYDIDTKIGTDLDDFVSLFGVNRLQARRSTGVVVFSRAVGASTAITIPIGTQVATEDPVPIVVSTLVPAVLLAEQENVSVPVQALIGGATGNVPANSLRRRITPLPGVGSMDNPAALTGGADAETDTQLRDRFKRTVFRNLAGTEHMYLAQALDDKAVTHANVIGAFKRHREQIQMVAGEGTSTVPDAKYVYDGSSVFGANIDGGEILVPGLHYTFVTSTPPEVTSDNPVVVNGDIFDLEFAYVPEASRNDPANGVTNRIDIYVNGNRPTAATETTTFSTSRQFTNTPADALYVGKFQRTNGNRPTVGNYFLPYAFGPVTDPSINDQVTIGAITLDEGTDYFLVNDITATGGTPTSPSGIEIVAASAGSIANGSVATLEYVFNAVPRDVDRAIRVWRLITTDVQVHAAKPVGLNLYLAAIYVPGYDVDAVNLEAEQALSSFISHIGMNGVVQVSDLLGVVQQIPGIDAVRFLTSMDAAEGVGDGGAEIGGYAIRRVYGDGWPAPTVYASPVAYTTGTEAFTGTGPTYTIEVDSTADFPDFGTIMVGAHKCTYGGKTPTSFTDVHTVTVANTTYFAGQRVDFIGYPSQPRDVLIGDDEYPYLNSVGIIQKAQNTFYSFVSGA